MRRWTWRFIIAFRTNNNVRLAVFWIATVILLLFNLVLFGVGPAVQPQPSLGEAIQKYHPAYYFVRYGSPPELSGFFLFNLRETIRPFAWWLWFILFLWSVIYIPIAFRDEVARTWESAWRKARESRGGEEEANLPPIGNRPNGGPQPPRPPEPEGRGFSVVKFLGLEVLIDVVRDFLRTFIPRLIFRRR
mgnify:CR=1 FL=1